MCKRHHTQKQAIPVPRNKGKIGTMTTEKRNVEDVSEQKIDNGAQKCCAPSAKRKRRIPQGGKPKCKNKRRRSSA
ncbi:hypothetical protein BM221_001720 [Beauveria bassiana]|uniref:Uncharacterized protein n=1 Tax=Beauveria bassiana TaxID=176275 RepID=A0A2N6NWI9_BEABA|nr:hypothetical protein BM221_001720 [Beauveria bassiana]